MGNEDGVEMMLVEAMQARKKDLFPPEMDQYNPSFLFYDLGTKNSRTNILNRTFGSIAPA
jgi:hypothetical protein